MTDFPVPWVLVDSRAEQEWEQLDLWAKLRIHAMVKAGDRVRTSTRELDRLEDIGVYNDIVFHLYAVPDDPFPDVRYCTSAI